MKKYSVAYRIIIILCVFSTIRCEQFGVKRDVRIKNQDVSMERENIQTEILFRNIVMNKKIDSISPDVVVSNTSHKLVSNEFVKNGLRIILKVPSLGCSLCYESELEVLEQVANDIGQGVLVLTDYRSPREMEILKKKYDENLTFMNISSGYLAKELDLLYIPYYLELGDSIDVKTVFIPDRNFKELSKYYLTRVLGAKNMNE